MCCQWQQPADFVVGTCGSCRSGEGSSRRSDARDCVVGLSLDQFDLNDVARRGPRNKHHAVLRASQACTAVDQFFDRDAHGRRASVPLHQIEEAETRNVVALEKFSSRELLFQHRELRLWSWSSGRAPVPLQHRAGPRQARFPRQQRAGSRSIVLPAPRESVRSPGSCSASTVRDRLRQRMDL